MLKPGADAIDALLPQTQCTRCGFAGCRPYAEAIERGEAGINQCPPGGAATILSLSRLLGREPVALDPAHGTEREPTVAWIDESLCIGCARCLPPCPVDAIVGAARQMHTVLVELCTGCELCIAPCPVDCITLVPRSALAQPAPEPRPAMNLQRFSAHNLRLARRDAERQQLLAQRKQLARGALPS